MDSNSGYKAFVRWRCFECSTLVPESAHEDHKLRGLANKLQSPIAYFNQPYHKRSDRHGRYYQCGPVEQEYPSDYHLAFEHFVDEDIPTW